MAATQTKVLYAPIDHAVIHSPAFADLTGEAVRLLLIIASQWTPATNGKLQATHSFAKPRGVKSSATMAKAVAELISHGFIYRTKSRGLDTKTGRNLPALYAITWKQINLKERPHGMHLSNFVFNAYKKWSPSKKLTASISEANPIKNQSFGLKNRQRKPLSKYEVSATTAASTETSISERYEILAITRGISETPPIIRRGTYSNLLSVRNYPKKLH